MDVGVGSFWRRVNALIKSRNTKQEAIAAQCNISYQTFRGWVTRKSFPNGYETFLIAQALGTTVEHLITGNKPEPPGTSEALREIQSVIDKYQNPKL